MESNEARAIRRSLSSQLTKTVNTVAQDPDKLPPLPPAYPEIRIAVIEALAALNRRLIDLNEYAQTNLLIDRNRTLVRFYMKGGNAFECIYNPEGPAATRSGGGNSDWDTQIIVDPWAPLPVQTQLYSLIEDIVMDEMTKVGQIIAERAQAKSPINPVTLPGDEKDPSKGVYGLTCDKPQTFRQVFDYNRIGLWMNSRRELTSRTLPDGTKVESQFIPGIIFNEGIQPFALYRLGYTWHAAKETGATEEIIRPVLMELIDVTLPRRNTVEAVAVWQELETNVLIIVPQTVSVVDSHDAPLGSQQLPLPTLSYHLREIGTMLCEIADGSSHHMDKLPKRFERLDKIYGAHSLPQQTFTQELSSLAGVANITQEGGQDVQSVTNRIQQWAPIYLQQPTQAFQLARRMMNIVASRVSDDFEPNGQIKETVWRRFRIGRDTIRTLLRILNIGGDLEEAGFSDDLRMMNFFYDNGYIQVDKVKFSGIDMAMVLRVTQNITPDILASILTERLNNLDQFQSLILGMEDSPIRAKLIRLLQNGVTVHSRPHNTVRPAGITYECTLVVSSEGRSIICLTLTSASRAEAPFRMNPAGDGTLYCAPVELASQRKVEAALIEDYMIRTAIAGQYEILKRLLPGT